MEVVNDQENMRLARLAFERGDYQVAQSLLIKITQGNDDESKILANQLAKQLRPSALSRYLLGLTFAILLVVTAFAYSR